LGKRRTEEREEREEREEENRQPMTPVHRRLTRLDMKIGKWANRRQSLTAHTRDGMGQGLRKG